MTNADTSPFDQQVASHRDYLLRFARLQLRNETWAEDAVSETLLAALSKPLSFASRSQLKTWLVGILKHKIIDALRHHGREVCVAAAPMTNRKIRWSPSPSRRTGISGRIPPMGQSRAGPQQPAVLRDPGGLRQQAACQPGAAVPDARVAGAVQRRNL
jgi:DNA-directed RNA polymerase specialized sigma24 family protein